MKTKSTIHDHECTLREMQDAQQRELTSKDDCIGRLNKEISKQKDRNGQLIVDVDGKTQSIYQQQNQIESLKGQVLDQEVRLDEMEVDGRRLKEDHAEAVHEYELKI